MREILFRGKRCKGKRWVIGQLWHHTKESKESVIYSDASDQPIWVIRETVGQFTGLTDKAGKQIYEGDILRRAYHPNDDVIVEWNDGRFRFRKRTNSKDCGYESIVYCQQTVCHLAVIGNIHENPELMEE